MRLIWAVLAAVLSVSLAAAPALAHGERRSSAIPVNEWHRISEDWSVKTVQAWRNADARIAAENMFNDPPRAGYQYVLVRVGAKKMSGGEGNAWWDLSFGLFGRNTKRVYSQCSEVEPDGLSDKDSVYKGGRVFGNLCFEVKKADIRAGGLRFFAEDSNDWDAKRYWFRIS